MVAVDGHGCRGRPWLPWTAMAAVDGHGCRGRPWLPWTATVALDCHGCHVHYMDIRGAKLPSLWSDDSCEHIGTLNQKLVVLHCAGNDIESLAYPSPQLGGSLLFCF